MKLKARPTAFLLAFTTGLMVSFASVSVSVVSISALAWLASSAWAQDEGDEFFEDDSDIEPYIEDDPYQPPTQDGPTFRQPSRPFLPKATRPENQFSTPSPSGEVEFKLVDPPKYWKPQKRKSRPKKPSPERAKKQ